MGMGQRPRKNYTREHRQYRRKQGKSVSFLLLSLSFSPCMAPLNSHIFDDSFS